MEIKVTDFDANTKLANAVKNRNTYIVNGYKFLLIRHQYQSGEVWKEVNNITDWHEHLPPIGQRTIDYRTGEEEYVIHCIAGGTMNPAELQDSIAKYQTALDTIEWLNAFDWNKTDVIVQNV